MSKRIRLTAKEIETLEEEFSRLMRSADVVSDGKVSFSKTFELDGKATVIFSEFAWTKMQALIKHFDKEVAWHAIARRGDNNKYFIDNILVYPQTVTGATVTTDQEKYQNWLLGHEDDVFNNIRCQGHSHVNMGVTPSGVDLQFYDSILSQLDNDMFYIFMIWNKKGDKTIKIYDFLKNVLFETSDCEVKIQEEEIHGVTIEGVSEEEEKAMMASLREFRNKNISEAFVKEAKELVRPPEIKPMTNAFDDYMRSKFSARRPKYRYNGACFEDGFGMYY